jgi:DNA polymerase-3 subunit gamma/tau
LELLERLIDSGIDLPEFVLGLLDHLRNLLVAKAGGESEKLFDLSQHYIEKYKKEAGSFSETDLLRMIKIVVDLNYTLKRTTEPRIHLEVALMKLVKMDSSISLENLFKKLDQIGNKEEGIEYELPEKKDVSGLKDEISERSPVPEENSNQTGQKNLNLSLENLRTGWSEVLSKVKGKKASLWSCLSQAEILSLDNGVLLLGFPNGNDFHKKQVEKRDNLKQIQEITSQIFQNDIRISFSLIDSLDHVMQKSPVSKKESIPHDIPGLKEILENLDGEIIDKKPI